MRWALFAIALAACNGGQGVDIEVHSDGKSIDAVELWLAYGICKLPDGSDCDGIAWPGAKARPPGTVFTLPENDERVFRTETLVDGVAQIHLETVPGAEAPFAMAVVGFHGTDVVGVKLISPVEIPTDDQARWVVKLREANDATDDITKDPGEGSKFNARVWARKPSSTLPDATGYTGCLAYQHWTGSEWESLYFVPNSDPDCDGDPPDCNAYWYDAPVGSAKCVGEPVTVANVCAVGNVSCRAETDQIGCDVQAPLVCVPSALCNTCADTPDLVACLKAQVGTSSGIAMMPAQKCSFVQADAAPCANSTNPVGWTARFTIRGATCATAGGEIAVLRPMSAPFSGGGATLPVNGAGMLVHAATSGGNCLVDVTQIDGPSLNAGPVPVIVAIHFGTAREILIPVLLDFQTVATMNNCPIATPVNCMQIGQWPETTVPGDSMFRCAVP
ncbi:MAG TPA: hypothetical protein VMZ53_13925 [Kofleriaceae bacterium]|nr:hypothetical protein [Kofleriaceae bacterium]